MSRLTKCFDAFSAIVTNTLVVFLLLNFVLFFISPPDVNKLRGYLLTDYAHLRYVPYTQFMRARPEVETNERVVVIGNERLLTASLAAALKAPSTKIESLSIPFGKGFDSTLLAARILHRGEKPKKIIFLDSNFDAESAPFEALRDAWDRSQYSETVVPLPGFLPVFSWANAIREENAQLKLDSRATYRYPLFREQIKTEREESWPTVALLREAMTKTFQVPYISIWARCGRLTGTDPKSHRTYDEACSNTARLAAFISDESLSNHQ